jgi:ATP adenylyltransferase/5',5'''-P-1,P-4-tetraphosphate phosphorylase II
MFPYEMLHFDSDIAAQKPVSIINPGIKCPFCDREHLENILDQEGDILLVKNKYPVLKNTMQTVLIETRNCTPEFSEYPKEHLHKVVSFGMKKWLEFEASGEYASVLFYKNHGPFSGGTLTHPHMQIIGLKDINYRHNVLKEHFEGTIINQVPGVEFNIATKPRAGFNEFNIVLKDPNKINQMADYLQIAAHYSLHHYHKNCHSYNIFFYQLGNEVLAKVMPRFMTSPLFVGFSIPQLLDKTDKIRQEIQEKYF